MRNQWWASLVLLASSVGCDQISKRAATEYLEGKPPTSFLGDTLRLLYAENCGAFLGLGSAWPELVRDIVLTLVSSAGLVLALGWLSANVLFRRERMAWPKLLGFVLMLAGGIGNVVDRLFRDGAVVDFLNLGVGSLRTGIFNLADVYLAFGAAILVVFEATAATTTPLNDPRDSKTADPANGALSE